MYLTVIIERTAKKVRVTIVTARPGYITFGKKGAGITELKLNLLRNLEKISL